MRKFAVGIAFWLVGWGALGANTGRFTLYNNSGSSVGFYPQVYVGYWTDVSTGVTVPAGGSGVVVDNCDQTDGLQYRVRLSTGYTGGDRSGGSCPMVWNWNGSSVSNGVPASTYYMSGCITNNTGFVVSYGFKFSDSYPNVNSGPVVPNGVWCYSRTNSSPFTYTGYRIVYNSDGGTNDWFVTDPYSAWTNSVPGEGGSGSALDYASPVPLQPGSGQGNNSGLTGDQFSKGVKSILDALWQGFQNLIGAQRNTPVVVNIPSNNIPNYSGVLSQIQTNTDDTYHAANLANMHLAYMETNIAQSMEELRAIKTNGWGLSSNETAYASWITNTSGTGFLGLSNDVWGAISIGSNSLYASVSTNSGPILAMNDVTETHELSFWKIPGVYSSVAKWKEHDPEQVVDWTPTNTWLWDMLGWVKICATWGLALFGMWYVRGVLQARAEVYYGVTGGHPAKGSVFNWWTWIKSVLMSTSIFAAVPVMMGAALQTVLTDTGTDMASGPLSATAINGGGGRAAAGIHEAVWCVNAAFPIAYAIGLGIYLWFFTLTVDTWLAVSSRLQRAFGN